MSLRKGIGFCQQSEKTWISRFFFCHNNHLRRLVVAIVTTLEKVPIELPTRKEECSHIYNCKESM